MPFELEESTIRRLLILFAASHDIGKLTPSFQFRPQQQFEERNVRLQQAGLADNIRARREANPHGVQSARILHRALARSHWPPGISRIVASIVGGHHGTYVSHDDLATGYSQLGGPLWVEQQSRLLIELQTLFAAETLSAPQRIPASAAVLISGFVSICDWIASNEDFFPFYDHPADSREYLEEALGRAQHCLGQLGWSPVPPASPIQSYSQVFPIGSPSPLQKALLKCVSTASRPTLYIVESPMGDGKTEAALAAAEQLRFGLDLGGLYIALPTQATSEQMFKRLTGMLERHTGPKQPSLIALLHSQASVSREYEELRRRGREYFQFSGVGGLDSEPRVLACDWFAQSRRGLLAPYGVGTVDQALLAVLASRHFFVRLFGLAGKVLVIDEVHAYDTYMSTLLDRLLEWAAALEIPTVLLSATLPARRREALVAAYAKGLAMRETPALTVPRYPRLTALGRNSASTFHVAGRMPARNVTLRFLSEDNLSAELAGAMSHGGNVALVANTVSRARKLYCALRSLFPGEVHLLHARYRVKDRQQRVAEALARVSRNSVRPFRSLLISTQVIEQSLDIDFDLLISELPPVDLLLQRMGRLHRHERQPHPSFPHPATWILDPPLTGGLPRFGDSAYVYAPHILLRSWWTLKDLPGLVLPDQIDSLIEAVYGDQPNPCEGVLAKEWNSTLENMQRARTLEEANAQEAYIGAPHFTDPINLVRNLADAERKIAATRQFRRSVSLVVLYAGRGDRLLLEPDDPVGISIYDDLTIDQIRLLLERSVTLPLRSQEAIPPAEFDLPSAWRKRTALESLKLLKLDEDHCGKTGDLELGLDPELGLCRRGENPTNLTV